MSFELTNFAVITPKAKKLELFIRARPTTPSAVV